MKKVEIHTKKELIYGKMDIQDEKKNYTHLFQKASDKAGKNSKNFTLSYAM